jgi:hypothetical protein
MTQRLTDIFFFCFFFSLSLIYYDYDLLIIYLLQGEPLHNEKRGLDPIESLGAEQQRHIELAAMAQVQTTTSSAIEKLEDPLYDKLFRDSTLSPRSPTVRSNNSSKSGRNAAIKLNPSGSLSMEYSQDDSTLMSTGDKSVGDNTWNSALGSTLLGQHYTGGDASTVLSNATKETCASTREPPTDQLQEVREGSHSAEQEESNYNTLVVESTSTSYDSDDDEPVPSDEELFAAGWAKTLDSNSGNYYYFTLDRATTVWDNPLVPASTQSDDDSSVCEI